MLLSLGNVEKGKFSSYNKAECFDPSPAHRISAKSDDDRYYVKNPAISSLANAQEKLLDDNVEEQSFPSKVISKETSVVDESSRSKPHINSSEYDLEIVRGLDDDLGNYFDKNDQIHAIHPDGKEKFFNSQLTNKNNDIDSLNSAVDCENIISFVPKGEGTFPHAVSSKLKNNIPSLDIKSSEKLQTGDCDLLLNNPSKKIEKNDSVLDDDLGLDFEDIEKELLSISSNSDEKSSPEVFLDDLVHQKKHSSDVEKSKDKDLVFDLTKIVRFEEHPRELGGFVSSSLLLEEEKILIKNVHDSLGQDNYALSEERGKSFFFKDNSASVERESFLNKDQVLANDTHHEKIVASSEDSVGVLEDDFKSVPPTLNSDSDVTKDSAQNKIFWLMGYILIVVGCGVYWFLQLHREIDFSSGGPRVVNASKDPLKVVPNLSEGENDTFFDKVHEVYDRFSGKKPSFPKQTKLIDSQEKPVDLQTSNQDKDQKVQDEKSNIEGISSQETSHISDEKNKNSSSLESIVITEENPPLSQKSNFLSDNKEISSEGGALPVDGIKLQSSIPLPSSNLE
ncbi:hypothetical protein HUT03_01045 [Candidatus Liberibacter africanus]|uniref:hypothetical protein n=1 Tax=Liberibacter africanus TaxID=34020 RepID=UPI001AE94B6D|nr:hypothetical protein [Candidatus Liberibacter africanus]QTP63713.1 hypothetical protein HUT03_01045 [Candidatus Liberibacter africanus]